MPAGMLVLLKVPVKESARQDFKLVAQHRNIAIGQNHVQRAVQRGGAAHGELPALIGIRTAQRDGQTAAVLCISGAFEGQHPAVHLNRAARVIDEGRPDGGGVRAGTFPNQTEIRKRRRSLAIEIQTPGDGTVRGKLVGGSRLVGEIDVPTEGAHEGAATAGLCHRSLVDEGRVSPGQRADIGAGDRDGSSVRDDSLQNAPIPLEKAGRESQH